MKAFEIQLYPYKEHIEILKDLFGYRLKKTVDSLFPLFDYISSPVMEYGFFEEKYFIIQKGNLFGVVKDDGSIFIPPIYVQVIPIENYRFLLFDKNFKWGLKGIVREGMKLDYSIPCEFDEIGDYSEGFYVVKSQGKYGLEPLVKGNIRIIPQYEDIKAFHEGYAAVKKNGKWGFIDKTLNNITKFDFDYVESFANGVAVVFKDGRKYQIDFMGNDTSETLNHFECKFKRIDKYHEGLCAVIKDDKIGFVDIQGQLIIPLKYIAECPEDVIWEDDAPSFSEGFACVRKGRYWGYIDKFNRVVFPFVLDDYIPIRDGVAFVWDGDRIKGSQLLTCQHFYNYIHGIKIPFCTERHQPEPRYDSWDSDWSWSDLQDAYEAAYEI